jgi:hypothetical protein
MAFSLGKATPIDDTRGVGNGHKEIVEAFKDVKGHGGLRRHSATPAEHGVKHPRGQYVAGRV